MDNVKQFLQGFELDNRTATLLTATGCGLGALVVLVRKVNSHQETKKKIQRSRDRRDESLQRAEELVFRYKESVRDQCKMFCSLTLCLQRTKHFPPTGLQKYHIL